LGLSLSPVTHSFWISAQATWPEGTHYRCGGSLSPAMSQMPPPSLATPSSRCPLVPCLCCWNPVTVFRLLGLARLCCWPLCSPHGTGRLFSRSTALFLQCLTPYFKAKCCPESRQEGAPCAVHTVPGLLLLVIFLFHLQLSSLQLGVPLVCEEDEEVGLLLSPVISFQFYAWMVLF
jgi:hypothetical protein